MGNKLTKSSTDKYPRIEFKNLISIEPLQNLETHEITSFQRIVDENNGCIIVNVIRRPGCALCREFAEILSEAVEYELHNVKLIGIVHEKHNEDDIFVYKSYFNNNDIYYDINQSFFKAQGNRRQSVLGVFMPSVISAIQRATHKNIKNTLAGDGTLLGGIFILDSKQIWSEYREEYFGDFPPISEIVTQAQRASGDIVTFSS